MQHKKNKDDGVVFVVVIVVTVVVAYLSKVSKTLDKKIINYFRTVFLLSNHPLLQHKYNWQNGVEDRISQDASA